jgi:hypothetical protein
MRISAGIVALGALAFTTSLATAATMDQVSYHGFTIDLTNLGPQADRSAVLASIKCQIVITEHVGLPAATLGYFRTIPIQMMPGSFNGHWNRATGLQLGSKQVAQNTPVVLHEYLHAPQASYDPDRKARIASFFAAAGASGAYRADAYLLTNDREFFAMTGTAMLVGNIQREPFTRARVRNVQPDYADWLLHTLGVDAGQLPPQDSGWTHNACDRL